MRIGSSFGRGRLLGAIAIAAGLVAAGPAAGQESSAELLRRLERQLEELDAEFRLSVPEDQPISERLLLDYGGSTRFAFVAVDNNFGETRILRQTDGILYVRAELDRAHRFFGRLRFRYDDFNSGDAFVDGSGDQLAAPIGDRYWYEFDSRGAAIAETGIAPDESLTVRVGRQFLSWNTGLTLSEALYAGRVEFESGDLGLIGLGGLTPSSGTVDFDGSRPSYDRNTDRAFFGVSLEHRGSAQHRPFISALVQRDENNKDFRVLDTPAGMVPTDFDYDSEYWSIGSRGTLGPRWIYKAELVYQTGEGLSTPLSNTTGLPVAQTKEDIDAWAGLIGFTYLTRDEADTRFDLEFAGGSGDDDRLSSSDTVGGNMSGTDDHAFNGLGYTNTGLALAPRLSNILFARAGMSTSPPRTGARSDWLRLGVQGFLFFKLDSEAPISTNTNDETFVGGEIDVLIDWRIASDLSLGLRYGVFLPGDAMPEDEDKPRHFFYAGVTYAF